MGVEGSLFSTTKTLVTFVAPWLQSQVRHYSQVAIAVVHVATEKIKSCCLAVVWPFGGERETQLLLKQRTWKLQSSPFGPTTGTKRHQEAPRGTNRHQQALTGTKRHQEAPTGSNPAPKLPTNR